MTFNRFSLIKIQFLKYILSQIGFFELAHNIYKRRRDYRPNGLHDNAKKLIDVLPIDDALSKQKIKRVGFVKIEIEGFEHQFFSGATRLLNEFKPVFIFEHSPQRLIDFNKDEAEFKSFFKDYDIYQMHLGGLEPYNFDGDATAPDLLAIPKGREWGGNS